MCERETDRPLNGRGDIDSGASTSDVEGQLSELEQNGRLRSIVDNLAVGVFSVDHRTGRVIEANPAYARILGFASARDAIGTRVLDDSDDSGEHVGTFAHFLPSVVTSPATYRENEPIRFEAVRVRQDTRQPVRVVMTISGVRDQHGDVVRLDGIMEESGEAGRVESASQAGEQHFRLLFENAALGMVITTPELIITRANRAFCEFLDYEEGELSGMHIERLRHPEERHRPLPFPSSGDTADDASREWRFLCKRGKTVWGVITATWIRSADGPPSHAVIMVYDVTSHRQKDEDLLRVEKLESLGLLAGGIAHDFNNVLAAILGNLSLAEMMIEGNREVVDVLSRAMQATQRARSLTSQLLTFAKGGHPLKKVTCVASLLRESASHSLRGCCVTPRFDIQPGLSCSELDVTQVEQVFKNLFANAVQSMPEGGEIAIAAHDVTLEAGSGPPLPPGRYVRVAIRDEGTGIARENLAHVFDPYFAANSSGKGLGLATAHSVVKRHGGHISVSSEVGGGSTFTVYLAAAERTAAAELDERPLGPFAGQRRILVMDDEVEVQRVAAAMLRACGLEADLVSDGAAAITTVADAVEAGRPYAAVILDLTVPGGLGGAEIVGRLREIDPEVRTIVSSGYSASPVLSEYRRHGFEGVLPKPYTVDDLRRTLREVLGDL